MAVPVPNSDGSRHHNYSLVLIAVTALGIYLCYQMTMPFLSALVWALALAVMFTPVQRWGESKLKRPNLSAAISVMVIGLVFISVIGGVLLFGAAGLILGPVALTVTVVFLETWHSRTALDAAAKDVAEKAVGKIDAW